MKKNELNASLLEKILILGVVALMGATVAVYILLSNFTKTQAVSADHSAITAESSQKDIDSLQKSYSWLQTHQETVNKTNRIVAEATQYQYQDQAIKDIEAIAAAYSIDISSYTFTDATEITGAGAVPAAGAPAAPTPTATGTTSTGAPTGLAPTYIGLKLRGNINIEQLLLFLKKIEQNVTRMQVNNIALLPDEKGKGQISMKSIDISVLINQGKQE